MLRSDPAALALTDLSALGDAQEHVVDLPLRRLEELDVIGRDQRQVALEREIDQGRLELLLDLEMVAHQLDVETVGEHPGEAFEQTLGEAPVAARERAPDRTVDAAGERDQSGPRGH